MHVFFKINLPTHFQFKFIALKLTDSSSTVYSSKEFQLTANTLNSKLFDAAVAATIEEADIGAHDMMTCEVMIDGTDYDKRVEKSILEKTGNFKNKSVHILMNVLI